MVSFASTPKPPYYAVIFSSLRSSGDNGYTQIAEHVLKLAILQLGFLGAESTRGADGFGITISYWATLEAIDAWKAHTVHAAAQQQANVWYEHYELRVAKVERAYGKEKL